MKMKINTTSLLEVTNNKTNKTTFLLNKDGKWTDIDSDEYKKIIGDNKDVQ